jgi:hypothetical protein
MDFSLALIKSSQQMLIKNFLMNQMIHEESIVDLEELDNLNLQGVFTASNLEEVEEINSNDLMIRPFSHTEEDFSSMNYEQAKNLLMKSQSSWLLQNNLLMLEKLIPYTTHLRALWANDRHAFIEELWNLLRLNLATKSLKIVFNSIKKAQTEHEKDQLIKAMTEGERKPQTTDQQALGEALMKQYDYQIEGNFEIAKHDQESGQIIMLATINDSPIIMMAELFQMNPLQKALLTALFDGLQTQR